MFRVATIFALCCISLSSIAADGRGKISNLFFAGEAAGSHPNVVQFNIEDGFTRSGCNQKFAAVRVEDEHLVSAILAAKMSGSVIEVFLNPADIYYNVSGNEPNRCIVSAIVIP